jgi:rubredoxin
MDEVGRRTFRCGICSHVYREDEGDEKQGVRPETPFKELPEDWRCPVCDAPRKSFMIVNPSPS